MLRFEKLSADPRKSIWHNEDTGLRVEVVGNRVLASRGLMKREIDDILAAQKRGDEVVKVKPAVSR